jgi:recombinational DNA repair protein (RecF pathway)
LRNKAVHHIYTNPAFIVHSSPYGEAGKFLLLFTKDFGMIGAVAQGIRLTQSKLRYHIQQGLMKLRVKMKMN